jgi:predicted nuclease of restriction endonuclease-like (RecB) superfamily
MRKYKLVYDMRELGEKVFEFQSENRWPGELNKNKAAALAKNPPGPTVYRVIFYPGSVIETWLNKDFTWEAYNKELEDKKWKDSYFQRTGKQWSDKDEHKRSSKSAPKIDSEEKKLDLNACLELLGLKKGFSQKELKEAYRNAVKMNHPDKVASLSDEFKILAERRTKQINQAYFKLKRS